MPNTPPIDRSELPRMVLVDGCKVRELRLAMGLSQTDLAEKIGWEPKSGRSAVSHIETAKRGEDGMTRERAELIAAALGVSVADVARREPDDKLHALLHKINIFVAAHGFSAKGLGPLFEEGALIAEASKDSKARALFWAAKSRFELVAGNLDKARKNADSALECAERETDGWILASRERAAVCFFEGDLMRAREHTQHVEQLNTSESRSAELQPNPSDPSLDAICGCQCYHALAVWHCKGDSRGERAAALDLIGSAFVRARRCNTQSTAVVIVFGCWFNQQIEDTDETIKWATRLEDMEAVSIFECKIGEIILQWAKCRNNPSLENKVLLRERINAWPNVTGAKLLIPYWQILLADVYLRTGEFGLGQDAVNIGISRAEGIGAKYWLPDLYRIAALLSGAQGKITATPKRVKQKHLGTAVEFANQSKTVAEQIKSRVLSRKAEDLLKSLTTNLSNKAGRNAATPKAARRRL